MAAARPLMRGRRRVVLAGLQSRAALNGAHGTVLRVDVDSGRLEVRLDGSGESEGESVLVKPDNAALEPPADAT